MGPAEGNFSLGLNHVSERNSLYGIPSQVVTLTASAGISLDLMRTLSFGFFPTKYNRVTVSFFKPDPGLFILKKYAYHFKYCGGSAFAQSGNSI